jgi:hypothetical protein
MPGIGAIICRNRSPKFVVSSRLSIRLLIEVGYFAPGVLFAPPVPFNAAFIVFRARKVPRLSAKGLC